MKVMENNLTLIHKFRYFLKSHGFWVFFLVLVFLLSKDLYHSHRELSKQKAYNDSLKTEITLIKRKIFEADSILKKIQNNDPETIKNMAVSKFQLVREKERLIQLIPQSLQK